MKKVDVGSDGKAVSGRQDQRTPGRSADRSIRSTLAVPMGSGPSGSFS